jgi:RNA polymerase sigma-70 factor (ECF subfamily)
MTVNSESGLLTEAVWQEFHQRLRSYLLARVANEADAEDLLQDVFTRIHANAHRLGGLQSVTGWIYRITRNAVTDFYRAEATRKRHVVAAGETDLDANEPVAVAGGRARSELASCIQPLLTQLPPRYAAPIALTELAGATHRDAAEQMGLSLPAMKSRVSRGRRKLKELLLECCHVELDRRRGIAELESRKTSSCSCAPDTPG